MRPSVPGPGHPDPVQAATTVQAVHAASDAGIEVVRRVDDEQLAHIQALLRAAETADGHPALAEQQWLDLRRAHPTLTALLARGAGGADLAGYAQLTATNGAWDLAIVVHPGHRGPKDDLRRALLDRSLDEVARRGGGGVRYWTPQVDAAKDAQARAHGMATARDLLQLRCGLPIPKELRAGVMPIEVRAFRPGVDEQRWLTVNNRAFARHPEQSGWDMDKLSAREAEPWFDVAGFLLYFDGEHLAGSCWTKVHRGTDPPLGEIYVISVDPDHQRSGVGKALVLAGLDHLAAQGLEVGMLYVDADNAPARRLYESLGFTVDHVDRAYTITIAGS